MGHSVRPRPCHGAIRCEKTVVRQVRRAQRPPVQPYRNNLGPESPSPASFAMFVNNQREPSGESWFKYAWTGSTMKPKTLWMSRTRLGRVTASSRTAESLTLPLGRTVSSFLALGWWCRAHPGLRGLHHRPENPCQQEAVHKWLHASPMSRAHVLYLAPPLCQQRHNESFRSGRPTRKPPK